jgi:squalene-hopene/tetraprenyl-beta-curcumene cyclase
MSAGFNRLEQYGLPVSRLDAPGEPGSAAAAVADAPFVRQAVERTRDWLLAQQHPEGYWVGELEGDTILESEYILLLAWLGKGQSDVARRCADYIRRRQLPEGGWALYPGGPLEVSSSVKAYWALKITGHDPEAEHMVRAREAVRAAGGAERVNSFTRYYLALLGAISYRQCPAVPPEIMLVPTWAPFNIYEMSSWSRTILVPLSLLWAFQPVHDLPEEQQIRELFLTTPEELPVSMPPSACLDAMRRRAWLPWDTIFRGVDRAWKACETARLKPFRRHAIRLAEDWIVERLEQSDGLGAIFPPIIWSVIALRCLGYAEESPEVSGALEELEKLHLADEQGAIRLQPCKSPVWDTAIAALALREADVPPEHPALRRAVDWLLGKEVRRPGDWSVRNPRLEPGGWFFEFNNVFYPDVDDTMMVSMALAECLPGSRRANLSAALVPTGPQGHTNDADLAAVVFGRTRDAESAAVDVEAMQPVLAALRRGLRWMLGMQSRCGGWGAFDRDNDRELLTRVPFADHNAMIDPPTPDITARALEMFGRLGVGPDHPALQRAIDFVWREQDRDHCWYGRWGVNYIYGTWQVLVGLRTAGVAESDPRIRRAAQWLKGKQQPCGGWGESAASYDVPALRGQGPATASQTAWALMGLLAAGATDSDCVKRGVQYLLDTQNADGTWDEDQYTGTGFPRVFYLKYHLYRIYFPLMALARYARVTGG